MGTLKFASTLFLMSDVLPHVAMLSKRFQKESVAWYQIAAAVESTQDVLVAFKLSDGMYMQALIKELKLQPGLKAVDDVKDNVEVSEDEELVEGQQSSVNGAREEKEDEEVEPIEIKDEVQQRRKRIVMRRMRSQTATPRMMDMASLARVECTSGCVSGRSRSSNPVGSFACSFCKLLWTRWIGDSQSRSSR